MAKNKYEARFLSAMFFNGFENICVVGSQNFAKNGGKPCEN